MSKSLVLNSSDLPTQKELVDAISRLQKDFKLLQRVRGKNDTEDPESFKKVIGLLEILVKRDKKSLPAESSINGSMETMIEIVARHLMDMEDWELKRTIEETGLSKVMERIR